MIIMSVVIWRRSAAGESMAVISRQDHYQFIIVFLLAGVGDAVQIKATRSDSREPREREREGDGD